MCGIAGLIDLRQSTSEAELADVVDAMTTTLAHRGPDDAGIWVDPASGLALGHRRLSIVDLSPTGQQPMLSRNQRYVISYNGEVYNALELRAELEAKGHSFRGHSDTEVIVEGCVAWGVAACIKRLNGMFALAIWDREERVLSLVRDRCGIKPLYWGKFGSLFLFGSELKSLRAHPGWQAEVDRDALSGYMRHGYIAAPYSIYRGVQKLEPGHILTVNAAGIISISCYWDIRAIARRPAVRVDPQEAVEQLDTLLRDAVQRCMLSDVPLGAFLSGGIDSSTVVALMQRASTQPVRTFTIGFEDARYNEASHAKAVAAHLGTDHTELYVENRHLLETIPELATCFDEPFADPSQIPTYLLSSLTRKEVTVALSGDGGDELFGGYARYFHARRLWASFRHLPQPLLHGLGRLVDRLSVSAWEPLAATLPASLQSPRIGDKLHKLADFLNVGDSAALYLHLLSHWPRPDQIVLNAHEPHGALWDRGIVNEQPDFIDQMRLLDFLTYLPDHVLTKVDRTTMAVGLEARVPLLDHRVAEFAWSVPSEVHVRGESGKWLLRQVLDRYVPRHLIERPKWGFIPPLGDWLRGPLRQWAEALLDEHSLQEQGFLTPKPIQMRWRDHLKRAGEKTDSYSPLWNVLVFQSWLEAQRSAPVKSKSAPRRVYSPALS